MSCRLIRSILDIQDLHGLRNEIWRVAGRLCDRAILSAVITSWLQHAQTTLFRRRSTIPIVKSLPTALRSSGIILWLRRL